MALKTGMVAVMNYFGMKLSDLANPENSFKVQWSKLTDEEKEQLKTGIGTYDDTTRTVTGSLTY